MREAAAGLIEQANVAKAIAAPVRAVWALVSDFANPERIVPGLASPVLIGEGIGMVRLVRVSSRTMRERLLARDEAAGILRYKIGSEGDMPVAGLSRLVATITMRPVASNQTDLQWQVRGAVAGDPAKAREKLTVIYEAVLARIACLFANPAESANTTPTS